MTQETEGLVEARLLKASDVYVGRLPRIGKHRALNNIHLKQTIERLDAVGETEAADTIAWLMWWRDIDSERERFLISDWQERLSEKIDEAGLATAIEEVGRP